MTDCRREFPDNWFHGAKLCHQFHDPELNFFGINASQPLWYWREKGWIDPADPRGWFSGTAATIWAAGARTMPGKSAAGRLCEDTLPRSMQLPPRRSRLPAQAASGAAALGL